MGVLVGPAFAALGAAAAGYGAAQIFTIFFVNLVLSGLSMALAGKRKRDTNVPIPVTVRSSTEFRRVVYGARRVHGSMVYYQTSSPNIETANKYLWYVVVFSGRQCQEISDVWIDKVRIAASDIDAGTGAVSATEFVGKMNIWKYLGTQAQTANADLMAALGEWTSAHRLRGNAYIVIRMERDDAAYPFGAPQDMSVLMKGALCFDPREVGHDPDDPSTWEYTGNPILHARDVISGGTVVNDQSTRFIRYGCREDESRIDDDFTSAYANICDELVDVPDSLEVEPRFACGIELSCGEKRGEWLLAILATCAGKAIPVKGKWRLYCAAFDTPTHTITDADYKGEVTDDTLTELDEAFNKVTSIYYPSHKEYVEDSGPIWTDPAYVTEDGEEFDPKELDLRGVTSIWQAERLEKIALLSSRDMESQEFPGGFDLIKIAPWETFTLSNTDLAISSRVFRMIEREVRFDEVENLLKPICRVRVETAAKYVDPLVGEYLGDSTPEAGGRDVGAPSAPSSLQATGKVDGILLTWAGSGTPNVLYEVQESTSSSMTSPTRVYFGADTQVLLSKSVTTTFYYRVRAYKNGGSSSFDPNGGGVSAAASSVSGGFRATASTSSLNKFGTTSGLTTASVTVTPVNGVPGYTYAWTWFTGGTGITIGSASSATTTFSVTGMTLDEERSGVVRCTVTDSTGGTPLTTTVDVNVHFKRVSNT